MKFFQILLLSVFVISFSSNSGYSQIYLEQNFESAIPEEWNEYVTDEFNWDTLDGGYQGHPQSAKQGETNAIFQVVSNEQPSTILVLPSAELTYAIQPDLNFFHAQEERSNNQDILEVFYKLGADSSWKFLKEYTNPTPTYEWVQRNIQLPDSALTDSCIIGFKATSNNGFGVCIDSVRIVERGEETRKLDTITFNQDFEEKVISESQENPILRIGIEVTGNTDTLALDSIGLRASNTNDDNIQENGVNLFYTDEPFFSNKNKVDSNVTITNGNIVFDSLDYFLPTGYSYFWVTYDIASDSTHEIHKNTIDAYIEGNAIKINNSTYPAENIYPDGERTILEAILYDDFNTDKGWTLTGEFERDEPQGLKGTSYGNADPSSALVGKKVLGTDLTGLGSNTGSYETNLSQDAYSATSKTINCDYVRDLELVFSRWLNVEVINNDTASIYYSIDNGNTWNLIWLNPTTGSVTEIDWNRVSYELPGEVEYQSEVKIRFGIGPTNDSKNYTGWNIDKLALIGDYIASDLSVTDITRPIDGCGHSSEDTVIARVKNTGADTLISPLPLVCSPDGGSTIVKDSIYANLAPGKDTLYKFKKSIDLSEPGLYDEFYVRADLANDEHRANDTAFTEIYAPPTYELPYDYDFEDNEADFWESGGTNSSWEWGIPSGSVITPDEGPDDHTWITNEDGTFNNNENSFVSSPCFDFREMDYPVIELKIYSDGNSGEDGTHVQYSLDGGNTWGNVDTLFYGENLNWDWYNNLDTIEGINAPGWDENNSGWYTAKTFLPDTITNKNDVKLRVHFGSNSTDKSEGIAFDDIRIFNAPDDVGIDSILVPYTQCETPDSVIPEVTIKNFGLDSIDVGDTIPVGIDRQYESESPVTLLDTCIVSEIIPPDSSYQYKFSKPVNLDTIGSYSFTAYTLMEEIPGFYNTPNNDTTIKQVDIYGYPTADLGPDIYTVEPDTVELSTPYDDYYNYLWQDNSTGNTYTVSQADTFHVTVTNDTTGCSSIDSAVVVKLIPDIGVDSLLNPVSDCELGENTYIKARVRNYGTDTLFVNDSLILGGKTSETNSVRDTFLMAERINPGESFIHEFNKPIDMSTLDTTYDLQVYSQLVPENYEMDVSNDTLSKQITSYGYPNFTLNVDTTVKALNYDIEAEEGYAQYDWEYDSENSSVFTVTDSLYEATQDEWYDVTVTDGHGCSATDSAHVRLKIRDLTISRKVSPTSNCELSDSEQVEAEILNNGTDTVFAGDSIFLGYDLNQTFREKDTIKLGSDLLPNGTLQHQFDSTEDMSESAGYVLDFYTLQSDDLRPSNDTLRDTTYNYEPPNITLGPDTVLASLSYTLDPGEFVDYLWHDGSTDRYFTVTDSTETSDDMYDVQVTDEHGCVNTDSVKVELAITDIKTVSVLAPVTACSYPDPAEVKMSLTNLSNHTFSSGTKIPVGYTFKEEQADDPTVYTDSLSLSSSFSPDDTIHYTFDEKVSLSENQSYQIETFTHLESDLKTSNDTASSLVEVYGLPQPDLGADTTVASDEYTLNPGSFASYQWHDESTDQYFTVKESTITPDNMYKVTVTDDKGCQNKDSVEVLFDYDLRALEITSPDNACSLSDQERVTAKFYNASSTIEAGDTLNFTLVSPEGIHYPESYVLSSPLNSGDTLEYKLYKNIDLSESGIHSIKAYVSYGKDVYSSNDTASKDLEVYGKPQPNLVGDTIVDSTAYTLDPGNFQSYEWHEGSQTRKFTVNPDTRTSSDEYYVSVTDQYGCTGGDTSRVILNIKDIEIAEILNPINRCGTAQDLPVEFKLENSGNYKIPKDTELPLSYQLNDGSVTEATLILSSDLSPDGTLTYTFSKKIELSGTGDYDFSLSVEYDEDMWNNNNDTSYTFSVNPQPEVDLGADTLETELPHTLDPGDYESYEWQDGSTESTFEVTEPGTYSVTVSNEYGCTASDTIVIRNANAIGDDTDQTENYTVKVYPVPAENHLMIDLGADKRKQFTIKLINTQGSLLHTDEVTMREGTARIATGTFPRGMYYLRIEAESGVKTRKVILK